MFRTGCSLLKVEYGACALQTWNHPVLKQTVSFLENLTSCEISKIVLDYLVKMCDSDECLINVSEDPALLEHGETKQHTV
jgi:hypothetical protein